MLNTRASLMVPRAAAGTKLKQIEQAKQMQRIVDERAARTAVEPPPYEFLEYIGRGSFGRVYKCKHRISQAVVVVKITEVDDADYKADFEDKDRSLPDLIKEIKVLQQLKETRAADYVNVIYDAFPMYSELWMVTEWCAGGSVTTLMKAVPGQKGLEERFIIAIARELATALKFVHEANVIHRDIKCGNVLITEDGRVQLCDFGVSGVIESEAGKRSTIVGTLHWMAPELLDASINSNYSKYPVPTNYRYEVDIWAYGCTVYEMAMGHGPNREARSLPALAAAAEKTPPRLEGDRFSDGLKRLVAYCVEANPENRPSAEDIMQHDYVWNTSARYPTSSLRELIERYVAWETSGGSRASLFVAGQGADAPDMPLSIDDEEDDWTFSTSDDLDDGMIVDLDDEPTTKPASKGVLNTAFTMPRTVKERESMVRRGGENLQRLFDPSDSTPYTYGLQSDLPLRRQYGPEGGNTRESMIDLDELDPPQYGGLELGEVPTVRANRLNKEALDRVIAELKEEDEREADMFQKQADYTKRATRDWKFPMMGASEPNNRRTQDWTFAGAMAEVGNESTQPMPENRYTRDLQMPTLTAPPQDINNRRTRDFVFPARGPTEIPETDVYDFGNETQLQLDSSPPDDYQPTIRRPSTRGYNDGYALNAQSAPGSPRASMIDLDFAMPTEYQFRPVTSGSGGDSAPFGAEYTSDHPFDLEDQVQLSESNNRLSYHMKSQSEPTKALPGLLTPSDQENDGKRGSKYGTHSRGAIIIQTTLKAQQIVNARKHMRRYPRPARSISRSSTTSTSETETDSEVDNTPRSPYLPAETLLNNDFWSRYNHSKVGADPSNWNRDNLNYIRASRDPITDLHAELTSESEAEMTPAEDRYHPFAGPISTLKNEDVRTAPPQPGIRTPATAWSSGTRPVVQFPLPRGPDPAALKHDAEGALVEAELQRLTMDLIYGLKVCKSLVVGREKGGGQPRESGIFGDVNSERPKFEFHLPPGTDAKEIIPLDWMKK